MKKEEIDALKSRLSKIDSEISGSVMNPMLYKKLRKEKEKLERKLSRID